MPWAGLVAAAAAVIAAASWIVARRAARQARDVTAMYWQLKFDHGELKARVDKAMPDREVALRTAPGTQFVPLTSVKR